MKITKKALKALIVEETMIYLSELNACHSKKTGRLSSCKSGDSYSYESNIYKRPITSARATQILMKIEECKWDEDIRLVAKQIKAGDMISPVR